MSNSGLEGGVVVPRELVLDLVQEIIACEEQGILDSEGLKAAKEQIIESVLDSVTARG